MAKNQNVQAALYKNIQISDNVKLNIENLMDIFNDKFPSVPLDNFCQRLETLEFVKVGKFEFPMDVMHYDILKNRVLINSDLLGRKDIDARFHMMKALLSVITTKENYYGFGGNRLLEPLNVGFSEIIANNLVGNSGTSYYYDEQIIVNNMHNFIGFDKFYEAFFTNNPQIIMQQLNYKSGVPEKTSILLEKINYNMNIRKGRTGSQLYPILKDLNALYSSGYDFFLKGSTLEQMTNLKYYGEADFEKFIKEQQTSVGKVR